MTTYMLDTCICAYIMRQQPLSLLQRLAWAVSHNHHIVISTITYAEMRYGQIGKKASTKHQRMVDEFVRRVDKILPWDVRAVDASVEIKRTLAALGLPIGENDTAIAGHAIAAGCTLITHNVREFGRVPKLVWDDWATTTPQPLP